jgi:hypothetical protein
LTVSEKVPLRWKNRPELAGKQVKNFKFNVFPSEPPKNVPEGQLLTTEPPNQDKLAKGFALDIPKDLQVGGCPQKCGWR